MSENTKMVKVTEAQANKIVSDRLTETLNRINEAYRLMAHNEQIIPAIIQTLQASETRFKDAASAKEVGVLCSELDRINKLSADYMNTVEVMFANLKTGTSMFEFVSAPGVEPKTEAKPVGPQPKKKDPDSNLH